MAGPLRVLSPDLVLVDWGPMTLTISAWARGRARPVMAALAGTRALDCLARLADFQRYLRRPARDLDPTRPLPRVVARALAGARTAGPGLTPLAAVAGAVAGEVADCAAEQGADRVLVNNGGDICLRLAPGQRAVVGIRPPGEDASLLARLHLQGPAVGGVASSGWAGRSLSPGVADLVTVWARGPALADAAATWLAGRVDLDHPAVEKRPAREVQPDSDLGDLPVTTGVGPLEPAQRLAALAAGRRAAESLYHRGIIMGCLMLVQGDYAFLDPGHRLEPRGLDRLRAAV